MSEKSIHPGLKQLLELGPVAAFFGGYLYFKDQTVEVGGTEYGEFIIVTALFIPLLLACTAVTMGLVPSLMRAATPFGRWLDGKGEKYQQKYCMEVV